MNSKLSLHVPSVEELYYRQRILAQPETMSYNQGYELGLDNYDNETGCIDFSNEYWSEWYSRWISNELERFYAYLIDIRSNDYVGEVSFHYDKSSNSHYIGIVIEAKHRGKGYCSEGLIKLAEKAFVDLRIDKLKNNIPLERKSAISGHKRAGFRELGIVDGNCIMELSKEQYFDFVR